MAQSPTKEITISINPSVSIHPSSSIPKQEIQNTFENPPSKEILCTDTSSCSIQPENLDSESSLSDTSNPIQTTKDNFNKIQLEENSTNYLLELSKVEEIPQTNSPPLFNLFIIPIKEIPSIPTKYLRINNKKGNEIFPNFFHVSNNLVRPTSLKQTSCI